jgi:hypothetical protein
VATHARQLERELASVTWELNDRRSTDKAREEDRLRAVEALRSATRESVIEECAKIADIAAIGASCRPDREIPESMCRLIAGEIRALKQRRYVQERS